MERRLFIGVDIGGTEIKGALSDEKGEIIKEYEIKTEADKGKIVIISNLKKVIHKLKEEHEICGIGVGSAGRINVKEGIVVYATDNLPGWRNTNIKELLEDEFNVMVMVENDANAALLGEAYAGAAKGCKNAVMLTLGTGVGGAIMVEGEILHGHDWSAGEFGHVILVPKGIKCNCGNYGCIEQYISGSAVLTAGRDKIDSIISHGKEIFELYNSGNRIAEEVIDDYLMYLSIVINNIYNSINPEIVIIGGGVISSAEIWWNLLHAKLGDLMYSIKVVPAQLGNRAGYFGALKLIMDNYRFTLRDII